MEADRSDGTETADSNAANYPRYYRVDVRTKRLLVGFGALLFLFGVLMSALHIVGAMKTPLSTGDLLVDACFAGFAMWLSFMVSRYVVLYEDRAELITWFARRTLARDEILGRKMGNSGNKTRYAPYYILVPKDPHIAALRFPPLLHYDEYFWAWMRNIPQIKNS